MRKFFNWFSSAFAILFAIPSFFILISWNALPGETLYGVKTELEDIALAVTIRTPLASTFSLNFTERRFSEATKLLGKKGSTVGYTLLVAEARQTQNIIVDQKDTKKAEELVIKIEEYQARIEEKKVALTSQPTAILPPQIETKTPSSSSVSESTPVKTAEPTQSPSVNVVIEDLEETNQELEEIKEEIKRQLPPQASERARENREEHERDNPRQH
jgi:hypothetical protein